MQICLADYCKKQMKRGKDRAEVVQWCADRFDERGCMNLKSYPTGLAWIDEGNPAEPVELLLKKGMILTYNEQEATDFMLRLHLGLTTMSSGVVDLLLSYLEMFQTHRSYLIWQLFWAYDESDLKEAGDNLAVSFGMFCKDLGAGPNMISGGCPYPILLSSLAFMLNVGVIGYTGDWVNEI